MNPEYADATCIVTGGGGFLGQVLVETLLARDAEVHVIDNFTYGASRSSVHEAAEVVEGDVTDPETFERVPNQADYVFHFAGPSSIVNFDTDAHRCTKITVHGFMNAVRFCIANDARLVYPSTGSLYAGTEPPHAETSSPDLKRLNAYAETKLSLELLHSAQTDALDAVGLRIFAGYGPQERQKGGHASVVTLFDQNIAAGERPTVFGDGTQKRDFVFVEDVAKATLAIGRGADEQIVNIGSGNPVSFNDLVEIINELRGTDIEPRYVDPPEGYVEHTEADTTLMEQYHPELMYSIEEGVAEVVRSR